MAYCLEKEEAVDQLDFDEHDRRCGDDGKKCNDIHDTDSVEDNIAWASQGFGKECHLHMA